VREDWRWASPTPSLMVSPLCCSIAVVDDLVGHRDVSYGLPRVQLPLADAEPGRDVSERLTPSHTTSRAVAP